MKETKRFLALLLTAVMLLTALAGCAKEPEMVEIAWWMGMVARDFEGCRYQVRSEVDALCHRFPIYE